MKRTIFLLMFAWSLAVNVSWADSVASWLDRMNDAVHGLNYSGTYVHINGDRIDTMQIVHRIDEGGEQARLLSMNGEAREILRDSSKVVCILPANHSVVVGKHKAGGGLPAQIPRDVLAFRELYDIELIGRDRVAGYQAVILSIEPKDKMRYGYRIWLEEESAMVLRSDILNEDAEVMEQMMFTEISLQSPVSDDMLSATVNHEDFKVITDMPVVSGHDDQHQAGKWTIQQMPRGFKITGESVKSMPMKKHPVQHIVVSDGLATVSVYIEKSANHDNILQGESRMGSVNAYGRVLNGHQITVMGEVPGNTVRQIAEAVAHR